MLISAVHGAFLTNFDNYWHWFPETAVFEQSHTIYFAWFGLPVLHFVYQWYFSFSCSPVPHFVLTWFPGCWIIIMSFFQSTWAWSHYWNQKICGSRMIGSCWPAALQHSYLHFRHFQSTIYFSRHCSHGAFSLSGWRRGSSHFPWPLHILFWYLDFCFLASSNFCFLRSVAFDLLPSCCYINYSISIHSPYYICSDLFPLSDPSSAAAWFPSYPVSSRIPARGWWCSWVGMAACKVPNSNWYYFGPPVDDFDAACCQASFPLFGYFATFSCILFVQKCASWGHSAPSHCFICWFHLILADVYNFGVPWNRHGWKSGYRPACCRPNFE